MAKKILKRSLALGALMAFVVTGSAMAADRKVILDTSSEPTNQIISNQNISDNTEGYGCANGGLYYVYFKNGSSTVKYSNVKFDNNTFNASTDGYHTLIGGAVMLKGDVTFTDTIFTNNVIKGGSVKTFVAGGAVYGDAAVNTGVYNSGAPNFVVTKDITYSGNNIIAAEGAEDKWYNTWGSLGQSAGGFLFLDRDSVAGFDIAENATLTIGTEEATGNMDSIASVIVYDANKWNPIINKNGKGTLTINGDLNKYYGSINLNAGTLNINKDWTVRNVVTVKDGTTLNVKNVALKPLLDGLDFSNVYGVESYVQSDVNYLKRPDVLSDFNEKVKEGNNGANATTVGSIIANNADISAESITNSGGVVSFTNSNFTGQITTGAGNSTLTFGDGNTWNLTGASSVTSATFGDGATLKIKGADFTDKYAITGEVTMAPTASLVIDGYGTNTAYKVVKGDNNIAEENLAYDRTQYFVEEETGNNHNEYQVTFKDFTDATGEQVAMAQQQAVKATGGDALAAPSIITGAIGPDAPAGAKELVSAITSSGASIDQKAAMVNAVAKIGEAGGTTANAASVVNNVTGITTQRLSFTNVSTTPQGGHGKVERKYKSGAGVWAQYMHGKDKVEDMPSAGGTNSYDSQYNGAVIGYDFKEVGKTHTGISFNYGEGDSHSKNSIASTTNDFDFWGVGAYTSIMNDDTNLIFDINYNKSDADVKQIVAGHEVTVNPNTTSLSVGVKAEKLIQNGPVQIVPYAGARFLTIDTDEYTSSAGTVYAPERQNIWLIPVGVSLRQENVYENGWKVTPKADLSYIWALGDTDSSMTVTTGAASDPIAYTVMDNGSFLGTVGIEAEKGDWTYGLSYSYQKGEYQRSDKWFVDVRYSF